MRVKARPREHMEVMSERLIDRAPPRRQRLHAGLRPAPDSA